MLACALPYIQVKESIENGYSRMWKNPFYMMQCRIETEHLRHRLPAISGISQTLKLTMNFELPQESVSASGLTWTMITVAVCLPRAATVRYLGGTTSVMLFSRWSKRG